MAAKKQSGSSQTYHQQLTANNDAFRAEQHAAQTQALVEANQGKNLNTSYGKRNSK